MRFAHISDLHIGKRFNEFSLYEDQEYILGKIINIIDENSVEGLIIAGDVYDKSVPSGEAVTLLDNFLVAIAKRRIPVFMISGNHDSGERLAFGGRLLDASGIYISPVYNGEAYHVTLDDKFGKINIYMLPFIKPSNVKRYYENEINSYTDAIKTVIDSMNINENERNILITHQFVTGATRSESEDISVGGSDNVDASVMEMFDYVALGHIHKPQTCGKDYIRYSGTPLKYSFSEAGDKKSVTIIELNEKNNLKIDTVPLIPLRDVVELRGTYEELTERSFYEGTTYRDDYVRITLTNEEDVVDAISKLRLIYKNLARLDYDNKRTRENQSIEMLNEVQEKTPLELFSRLYEMQSNKELSGEQEAYIKEQIERVWEDREK